MPRPRARPTNSPPTRISACPTPSLAWTRTLFLYRALPPHNPAQLMGTNRGGTEAIAPESRGIEQEPGADSYQIVQPNRPDGWDPVVSTQGASLLQSWRWGEFKRE